MALNLGPWSPTNTHDYRLGNAKVSAISAPTKGSTQRGTAITITFTLQSYVVTACSVQIKYSTDGVTWNNATITGAVTGLTVSEAGTSHTKTWNSVTDLGSNNSWANVQIGITCDDASGGGGADDRLAKSDYFIVDNLPVAPSVLEPPDGEFQKDLLQNIEFSISSSDPGSDKLYPQIRADMTTSFNSSKLVTKNSQDGITHLRFDHQVTPPTLKPIPGYYVQGVSVAGSTVVTYNTKTDLFTGATLPTTITNARVIVIPRNDRRVFITAVGNTSVTLDKSLAGGVANGLVDLFILSDPTLDFFVKSGVSVTSTSFAATTFASLGNDDFGQDITDTFGSAPRILVVDQADRMVILGTITTTEVNLRKSLAGGTNNGICTLFILKTNADIYQDTDEAVTSTTLTARLYTSLNDGGALPAYVPGAIVLPVPKDDRHVYVDEIVGDQAKIAKGFAGAVANGLVDWNIWTKTDASAFWVPMSPNGIPETYEGGRARYRPQSGEFNEGIWYRQVAFGNVA